MSITVDAVTTKALQDQVSEAVRDGAMPISRLLRLMQAINASPGPMADALRAQLRARIGAPPQA